MEGNQSHLGALSLLAGDTENPALQWAVCEGPAMVGGWGSWSCLWLSPDQGPETRAASYLPREGRRVLPARWGRHTALGTQDPAGTLVLGAGEGGQGAPTHPSPRPARLPLTMWLACPAVQGQLVAPCTAADVVTEPWPAEVCTPVGPLGVTQALGWGRGKAQP